MKSRSDKTNALYRKWNPVRRDFVEDGPCAVCGGRAIDCHEILAGSHRMNAFVERCCWLRLCRFCHDWIQGTPIALQLAYKLLSDAEYYDRERVCEVWGRAPNAITADEVLNEVRNLLLKKEAA